MRLGGISSIRSRRTSSARLVLAEHDAVAPVLRSWSTDGSLWRRRSSIIAQLLARAHRRRAPLRLREPNRADREFFVRKAIGWALRECSKTDGEAVVRYIDTHELSPLSRREALKWLDRHGLAAAS